MTISETIRDAVTTTPMGYLGVVESHLLNFAFAAPSEWGMTLDDPLGGVHWRTYALFVAEALE